VAVTDRLAPEQSTGLGGRQRFDAHGPPIAQARGLADLGCSLS
jgi:hypothetical protein